DLEKLGIAHRIRSFRGTHEWATPEIWPEIFAWIELQAMKRGLKPTDKAFLRAQLDASQQRAKSLEESGDLYGAYDELRCTAADLNGLLPSTSVLSQVQRLQDDKRVKAGGKRLQGWLDLQTRFVATVDEPLQAAREGSGERQAALLRTRMAFHALYE